MSVPEAKEKWTGKISTVTIGATQAEGGTRGSTVTIGGQTGIPFLSFDGEVPHPPAIALEVFDAHGNPRRWKLWWRNTLRPDMANFVVSGTPEPPFSLALLVSGRSVKARVPVNLDDLPLHGDVEEKR